MPEIFHLNESDYTVIVWKIEEPLKFFLDLLPYELKDLPSTFESRNLEWLASRYVLYRITDQGVVEKDEFKKPFLINDQRYISISHSDGIAAAMLSKFPCGIDIENDSPRINRIASKFILPTALESLAGPTYQQRLYQIWCAKEAMYKAYGLGQIDFKSNLEVDLTQLNQGSNTFEGKLLKSGDLLTFQLKYHYLLSSIHLVYGHTI